MRRTFEHQTEIGHNFGSQCATSSADSKWCFSSTRRPKQEWPRTRGSPRARPSNPNDGHVKTSRCPRPLPFSGAASLGKPIYHENPRDANSRETQRGGMRHGRRATKVTLARTCACPFRRGLWRPRAALPKTPPTAKRNVDHRMASRCGEFLCVFPQSRLCRRTMEIVRGCRAGDNGPDEREYRFVVRSTATGIRKFGCWCGVRSAEQ